MGSENSPQSEGLQACRDCLPVPTRLQAKGVSCPANCLFCTTGLENSWHIFLTCPSVQGCREEANLWQCMEPLLGVAESFSEFVFRLGSILNWEHRGRFVMLLWSLWRKRNLKIWEDKSEEVSQVIFRASSALDEWKLARSSLEDLAPPFISHVAWETPLGWLKCNVDAAFFKGQTLTSFGCCLRDEQGTFVLAKTGWYSPVL